MVLKLSRFHMISQNDWRLIYWIFLTKLEMETALVKEGEKDYTVASA